MNEVQEFNDSLRNIKYNADEREKFCFKYYNLLKTHVSLKYGDYSDWEDIVHDVINKIIETDWTNYPQIKNPVYWLYTIADNHAKDIFKKNNRICEFKDNTYSNFNIETVEMRNDVREAIKHLKRETQYVVYAQFWLGKELYTIAEEMHMSYVAVRVAAFRARKIIKKYL